DGVEGETTDAKHKGEFEVLYWSFGVSQAGTAGKGGGAGAGAAYFQNLALGKTLDKASPKLWLKCATGEHLKQAVLTCRKAGGEQQDYLKVTLSDVMLADYVVLETDVDKKGTNVIPRDSLLLNFAKIEFEFREQKADGTLGPPIKTGFDVVAK